MVVVEKVGSRKNEIDGFRERAALVLAVVVATGRIIMTRAPKEINKTCRCSQNNTVRYCCQSQAKGLDACVVGRIGKFGGGPVLTKKTGTGATEQHRRAGRLELLARRPSSCDRGER